MTIEHSEGFVDEIHENLRYLREQLKQHRRDFSELCGKIQAGDIPTVADFKKHLGFLKTAEQLLTAEGQRLDRTLDKDLLKERKFSIDLESARSEIIDRMGCLHRAGTS